MTLVVTHQERVLLLSILETVREHLIFDTSEHMQMYVDDGGILLGLDEEDMQDLKKVLQKLGDIP